MDGSSSRRAEMLCEQKVVKIPLSSTEAIMVQGEKLGAMLNIIPHLKALKCIRQGCTVFVVSITPVEPVEKRIKDIPVLCEYPDMIPEELPGLPPNWQV